MNANETAAEQPCSADHASLQLVGPVDAPLALDTEFVRERTFFPELALLQLRQHQVTVLVDPQLTLSDAWQALSARWRQAEPCVMHAAGEDLECLQRHIGVLPGRLFDTQSAAAFAGLGSGMGYQALVASVLGVELAKAETRSDWMRRPLSSAQCHYAAEDVAYLLELYQILHERLRGKGVLAWFEADAAELLRRASQLESDLQPQLAFRPAAGLPRLAQARIRRLLRWREREARDRNRPRNWLLDNELIALLATSDPGRPATLEALFRPPRRFARYVPALLPELLAPPLDADEQQMPLAQRLPPQDKALIGRLQDEVAAVAAEHDLPPTLLMARRSLEHWLLTGEWPERDRGWRQALLEPRLQSLRPG